MQCPILMIKAIPIITSCFHQEVQGPSDGRIMGNSWCCWQSLRVAILLGIVLNSLLITKDILTLKC